MRRLFTVLILLITIISLIPFNVFAHIDEVPLGHTCQWGNQQTENSSLSPRSANSQMHYIYFNVFVQCNCGRKQYTEKNLALLFSHQMTKTHDITTGKRYNATHHWDVVHRCKKCGTCPYINTNDYEELIRNKTTHTYNQTKVKKMANGSTILVDACICGKEKP